MSLEFAKPIASELVGRYIELYQGNNQKNYLRFDLEIVDRSVIRGILLEVNGECLKILCKGESGKAHIAYVNSWSVYTIVTPHDADRCLFNIYSSDGDRRPIVKQMKKPTED